MFWYDGGQSVHMHGTLTAWLASRTCLGFDGRRSVSLGHNDMKGTPLSVANSCGTHDGLRQPAITNR